MPPKKKVIVASQDLFSEEEEFEGLPETPGNFGEGPLILPIYTPTKVQVIPAPGEEVVEDSEVDEPLDHQRLQEEEHRRQLLQDTQDTEERQQQQTPEHESEETRRPPGVHIVSFSRRQEGELVEWFHEHECLYNRSDADYKNRSKKRRILNEKGASLEPPVSGDDLWKWFSNRRTQYGRVAKRISASGSARAKLTALEKWVMDTFRFLKPHIVHHKDSLVLGEVSFSFFSSSI